MLISPWHARELPGRRSDAHVGRGWLAPRTISPAGWNPRRDGASRTRPPPAAPRSGPLSSISRDRTGPHTVGREEFPFSGQVRPSAAAAASPARPGHPTQREAGPAPPGRAPPGGAGPRAGGGGGPGGGAQQRPDDREQKFSSHRVRAICSCCCRASGPAFSATDPRHGRASPVKALTVPAGSRCA